MTSRWTLPLVGVAGALAGAALVWASERGPATAGGAVGPAVRAYLLEHPEVIPEAMQRLQDRDTGRAVTDARAAIETPQGSAVAGNPHGDVTLVEYYDYNCGYCRASLPVVRALIAADPGVRVVYQELPVLAESSRDAARLSLAAAWQGKFGRFHDALYAAGRVSDATLAAAARAAGVDPARAAADRPRADTAIRANLQLAQRLGMTGTPSWVIGGRVIAGTLSLEQFREAVATARAR